MIFGAYLSPSNPLCTIRDTVIPTPPLPIDAVEHTYITVEPVSLGCHSSDTFPPRSSKLPRLENSCNGNFTQPGTFIRRRSRR